MNDLNVNCINFHCENIPSLLKEMVELNSVYLWDIAISSMRSEENEYSGVIYYVSK